MKRSMSAVSLAALSFALASHAQAQQARPGTKSVKPPRETLHEVVVTATKRATNLQKTPISMSVVTSQQLKDRHVQSLLDLADGSVPSLRIATFEARQTALTIGIRGIVPLDANQPAREQGVGVYIDGVYLGRQHGLNAALFDIDRIEVLKGPQGTLFGRNTEGGALSIVSRAPSGRFGGSVTAGAANFGGYNTIARLDLPEFHHFSVKLDGVSQYQGPAVKNPLPGQKGWNYYDRQGARVAVRWTPTRKATVDAVYDVGRDRNSPFYSQLLNYNPNGCVAGPAAAQPGCAVPGTAFTTLSGTVKPLPSIVEVNGSDRMHTADIGVPQDRSIDKTWGFATTAKYHFNDAIELRSISAWRGVDSDQWDNSGGAHRPPVYTPKGAFSRYSLANLDQHQFSQELQAVGSAYHIDYAGGLYYFHEYVSDDASTPNSNTWNANGTGYTINNDAAWNGKRSIDRASNADSSSYAIFGQATYTPVRPLHLTFGARNTWDDRSGNLYIVNNIPRPYTYKQNTSHFDPMGTIAYDLTDAIHVYGRYASGYRSGGASSRSITYRQFGPETVDSYEIGAKTEWLDRRVRFNVAGYIMDRDGSQIDFSSVSFDSITGANRNTVETVNAPGTTKIKGVEADLTVNPLPGLQLSLSYAYTYTRIPPVTNPFTGIVQNVYIVFTPRNAASGAIDYTLPVLNNRADLRLHLDGNYAQATQTFDQYATKNDDSFIMNARVALADISLNRSHHTRLTISAWTRNLTNVSYVYRRDPSNSLPAFGVGATGNINNVLGDYGNFNTPRTYGGDVTVTF